MCQGLLGPSVQVGGRRGVISASVSLESRRGRFEYDPTEVDPEGVRRYVEDAGFTASLGLALERLKEECVITVEGMTCQSCVKSIEGGLGDTKGVLSVKVSLDEGLARVVFDPEVLSAKEVADKIYDMGFDTHVQDEKGEKKCKAKKKKKEVVVRPAEVEEGEDDFEKCLVSVRGMTCASCVAAIEKHVKKIHGEEMKVRCLASW